MDSRSIHLSWRALDVEDRNGVIRGYQVNLTELETAQELTYTTTNLYVTIQGLHPSFTYWCRASAFTVATGPYTNTSAVTLPEDSKF